MEIRGYVSSMRWRLVILVLFPLVAGGVAYLLLADTPQQHRAETVLTVPSTVVGGPSSGSVAQYMANFEQAIVSDPVVTEVATDLEVDREQVREGLQTEQLGSSNLVRVSYQGTEDAARIVDLATRSAFELVSEIQLPFGQSLDVLEAGVRSANSQFGGAERRLERFLLRNGVVLPREEYLMAASEVATLERQIVEAEAQGSPTGALAAALDESRAERTRLAAVLPAYERLQAAVDRATDDLDAVEDELRPGPGTNGSPRPTDDGGRRARRSPRAYRRQGRRDRGGGWSHRGIRSVVLVPDEERDAREAGGWERGRVPRADLTTRDAVRGGVWISRS